MIERIEPTHQDYLLDFKERYSHVGNLDVVKERVLKGECPWDEGTFEKDKLFRSMRRYYRKHIQNGLMEELLNLIQEIESKKED